MFVCFTFVSLETNLIYSKKLVLLLINKNWRYGTTQSIVYEKDLLSKLDQVYYYTLFTYEQNITTIVSRLFTVNTDTIQMQKLLKWQAYLGLGILK